MADTQTKLTEKQIEELVKQAVKKVNGKKENDICHYLPGDAEGYIHHFTMRKMKTENPKKLADLLKKYILDPVKPKPLPPKRRAPRGTRKRPGQVLFSKTDIERLLHMARMAGDKELIRKLTPRQDLRVLKKELISSIRHNRIEEDLWLSYVETINAHAALQGLSQEAHFAAQSS